MISILRTKAVSCTSTYRWIERIPNRVKGGPLTPPLPTVLRQGFAPTSPPSSKLPPTSWTMAVASIRSSSLPQSFLILRQLNGPRIWWRDFLLTYSALLHILHSSRKEFLSTINSTEKGLFKKSSRRRFPQERNAKSRRARQTRRGRPMLPICWSKLGDGTT